ncbi:ribonuclease H-like domain-containing protein [Tanacetum coccineum]
MSPAPVSHAPALPYAFHTITFQNPNWNMDTGASSHLANNTGILTSFSNSSIYPTVFFGNSHSIPVTHTGHRFLHTSSKPLHLNHVLVTTHIIKILIYVRQFTRDNDVSVEFDAYGFSVKDYQTGRLLLRCDSTGDVYPVTQQPSSQTPIVLLSFSSSTWHRRLGHPGDDMLRRLESKTLISGRKSKLSALCHACQLSKHAKLPFYNLESSVNSVFEIIHSDIWTSPIPSESGIKYYPIFLNHFSHFVWVYPLHKKTNLFDNFVAFCAYVNKQFNVDIKALQCDHGGEYDNTRFHELFCQNGIQFWFSCPRTLQQNGKSERMLRTINNLIRTLLFQAHMPLSYWVEALNMDAHVAVINDIQEINEPSNADFTNSNMSPIQYHGAPAMSPAHVSHAPALPYAFHTMTLQNSNWNMDTGVSTHLANNTGILTSFSNLSIYPSVFVGNGHSIPVTHTGHSFLHTSSKPLHLNHIIFTPHIIKNLIYVHQFTRDNDVSVEFDAYGFSVKDYQIGRLLLRCDSTGDLYPVTQQPSSQTPVVFLSFSSTTWHRRLGHPGDDNGKSERMLRTINNLIRTLLFQAHMPPSCWVEALNMAAHLLNILPSTAINNEIPFIKLYNQTPTYEHLRVFGCLCYPHVDVSHKLKPRSTPCIFLGYPANHRGYRCLDIASNKIIISRHNQCSHNPSNYAHPTTPLTSPPQPDTPPFNNSTPISPQPDTPPSHSSTPIPNLAQTQPHAQTVHSHTPIPINNSSQTMSTHPMVTRAKAGIFKPLERMNCHVTTTSPLPRSHVHALRDPNWKEAMLDEYNALITNGTWVLVPRPTNVNVVRSMWLFKHKFNADGSLSRYKARLVANGHSQQQGIDCDETFSPVVKPATIRTVLSLAVSREWPIHQLDVKNAFFHGHLTETVYMHQPPGLVDSVHPDYACHFQRSLYGLKQAPRAWFQRFASFVTRIGFQHSKTVTTLFVFHRGLDVAYLLLYVDDIILTASSTRTASGMFLSQSNFAVEILERANMQKCNPCKTPVDTESKLCHDGEHVSDPTLYRSLAGALQYLTFTRPDLSYVVQQVCLYMHDPRDPHFTALKRILRYVCGTIDHGLQLHVSSTAQLTAYTDADWARCPVTRRSTSGYCVFLGDNLLSWSAKRQITLSRSSTEAEYHGVANVVAETAWLRNLLLELHAPLSTATIVYCDNVSVVYLSTNPVQHQRTKHIEIDIHFVRDYVASGQVRVLHVPSRYQYADIFTKGLPSALFLEFRSSLNVRRSPVHTEGEIAVINDNQEINEPSNADFTNSNMSPIEHHGAPAMSPAPVSHAPALPYAFHTMTLQNPNWNMDTGASSHLANNTGILTSFSNSSIYPSVFVGNGHSIPVTHTGHRFLHTSSKPLHLNHIFVTPHIIKNLIYVRQFTRDNDVFVEFDAYGFSVKDYQTGRLLLRCDSTGDLYPVTQQPSSQTPVVLLSFSSTTWHRRLGHPGDDVLRCLESKKLISCRKSKLSALCHACQLGKHAKLPFYNSESSVNSVFEIIHSDIWTSPIPSESVIKYYAIFLDHFSHFVWVYHLHKKADLFDNFVAFRAYVNK